MSFDGQDSGTGGVAAGGSLADAFGLGGAGDAGAGAAAGTGAADDAGGGAADPDWWAGISAEADGDKASNRDWLKASGVRDIEGLVKVARDNQAAVRESGRIKVPGEGAKPEEVAEFQRAIGVPDKVDGYQIVAPKDGDGNDIKLDTDLIGKLSASALKHGTPKAAFEGLVSDFIAMQIEQQQQIDFNQQQLARQTVTAWGPQADANMAAASAAQEALNLSSNQVIAMRNALGADVALNLLAKIGSGMAEDVLITGGKGSFGMNAKDAQAQLDAMKTEAGMLAKIQDPKSAERQKWDRLQAVVAAEAARDRDRANR